ncbi:alpha/beta fold hydrolase [Streptomyces sp. ET3-23]|uniref:alpha/beta fold hydrolase n=1 Tax=Streptomyces sp. ET3-23 TaxID=2885643 RepID=UPI001D0FDBB5|nr:alpha/beta fold hydrolase [Streptomyces sp. ET3-23]MCC2274281.1 alpha/beta fold hydrolase [Streptomyces sp. ET3-23]
MTRGESVTMGGNTLSSFTDDAARARFLAAYDRAMALWPDEREERDVPTRFGTTRVYVHGKGEGTPLVLLHGANATPAVWASNVAALAEGRTVLAVDRLGEPGRSVQTAPIRTADAAAAWLEELLAGLGLDRVHLAGQSYGGWLALNQAVHSPARLASVTLADPVCALAPLRPGFIIGALAAVASGSENVQRRYLQRVLGAWGETGEAAEALMAVLVEAMRGFRGRLVWPQRIGDAELRSVSVPVLLLAGGESRAADARRAETRARLLLPDVRAEVVPGAGHAIPVAVLNRQVPAFLRAVEGEGAP